jgi:HCOMODA/2-hydroxy-3-carboxy-muconic semialdehyde decarboxylase
MFLERYIHGEAFRARPDVNAVVHSHSPSVIPFTVTDEPLRAVSHIASFLAGGCPCFEVRDVGLTIGLLVTNNKQGAALAKVLGDGPVALMRGHGNLVVASDIPRVVHRALYTEVNAQQLTTALSFRRPIKYVQPDERQDPQRLGDSWDVWKAQAMGGK